MLKIRTPLLLIFSILISCSLYAIDFNQTLQLHKTDGVTDTSAKEQTAANDKAAVKEKDNPFAPAVAGKVKCNLSLRLRSWPWGKIKALVSPGTSLKVIGESGEFYRVSVNGMTGYMHKNYISIPGKPASKKEPDYPGKCASGGFIAQKNATGQNKSTTSTKAKPASTKVSTNKPKPAASSTSKPKSSSLPEKASVIGKPRGDGTVAGALTWARDQINGTKKGFNSNNNRTSKTSTAWNGYCLAFVSTAYGRKKSLLSAPSAIQSYYKCKAAGKIKQGKNPPAGAVMFNGTTSGNPYGHIYIATGKMAGPNDPIIITTGWSSWPGIHEIPMSKMGSGAKYLGWAMP